MQVSDGEGLCLLQRRLDHYQAIWLDARGVAHAAAGILSTNSVPGRRKLAALNEERTYPVEKRKLLPAPVHRS